MWVIIFYLELILILMLLKPPNVFLFPLKILQKIELSLRFHYYLNYWVIQGVVRGHYCLLIQVGVVVNLNLFLAIIIVRGVNPKQLLWFVKQVKYYHCYFLLLRFFVFLVLLENQNIYDRLVMPLIDYFLYNLQVNFYL